MQTQTVLIDEFWNWFIRESDFLKSRYFDEDSEELNAQIENRIARIDPALNWEIGPSGSNSLFFALSPAGDRSKLNLTRQVVQRAPSLVEWTFYAAKPAKEWDFRFSVSEEGKDVAIDASQWRYSLEIDRYLSLFYITLYADNFEIINPGVISCAAAIVVEGAIGEEMMLEHVATIDLLSASPLLQASKSGSISQLKRHLVGLLA